MQELEDIRNLAYVCSVSHVVLNATGGTRVDLRMIAQLRAAWKLRAGLLDTALQALGEGKGKDTHSLKPGRVVPQMIVLLRYSCTPSGSCQLTSVIVQMRQLQSPNSPGAPRLYVSQAYSQRWVGFYSAAHYLLQMPDGCS